MRGATVAGGHQDVPSGKRSQLPSRYLTLTMWPSGRFCRQAFTTQAVCSRNVMTRLRAEWRTQVRAWDADQDAMCAVT